jgi:hypothetical protein
MITALLCGCSIWLGWELHVTMLSLRAARDARKEAALDEECRKFFDREE